MNSTSNIPSMNPAMKAKMKKTMGEWKAGTLHSGSDKGPIVSNQKQAVAIGLNQARKGRGLVQAASGGAVGKKCPDCGATMKPAGKGMKCPACGKMSAMPMASGGRVKPRFGGALLRDAEDAAEAKAGKPSSAAEERGETKAGLKRSSR